MENTDLNKENASAPQSDSAENKQSFVKVILRYFISGTVIVLPLVVTVAIVLWLSKFFITWLGPSTAFGKMLSNLGIKFVEGNSYAYIFGWLLVLVTLFLIGFFAEVVIRQAVIKWFDGLIQRIPLIGMIYGTTRKFTDLVKTQSKDELKSMSPVYCRFGSQGGGVLVLALMPSDDVYEIEGSKYRVVIVPTAPVPFGGGMFIVPIDDVFPAKMSIEALTSFYVSMGVTGKLGE
ncbi:MAG: DUF502 domain-containing protein [Planctomycetia bacterium]|nr:DUF502 domain-containing protein [Planctomycetia bacterium]